MEVSFSSPIVYRQTKNYSTIIVVDHTGNISFDPKLLITINISNYFVYQIITLLKRETNRASLWYAIKQVCNFPLNIITATAGKHAFKMKFKVTRSMSDVQDRSRCKA